jgi:hypothetical protein
MGEKDGQAVEQVQSSGMSDETPEQALREFLRQRLENAASPRGVHLSREELTRWASRLTILDPAFEY